MAIAADQDLRAGAVVGEEEDDGVVPSAHGPDLGEHAADLAVDAIHHGGVNRHFRRLKALLLRRELGPRTRMRDLAGTQPERDVREVPRGADARLEGRQGAAHDSELQLAAVALGAHRVPARKVRVAVTRDVVGRGLQGEMRRREGEIREEGLPGTGLGMLLQAADRVVGEGRRGVVAAARRDGRSGLVILDQLCRVEVAVVVLQAVGAIEAAVGAGARHDVDVPLARVVRAVAERFQELRQGLSPLGSGPSRRVHGDLLRIVAEHQRGARGPASRGVVELGEAQAVPGEAVQLRRRDLAAVAPQVRIPHVVGDNEDDVGSGGGADAAARKQKRRHAGANKSSPHLFRLPLKPRFSGYIETGAV